MPEVNMDVGSAAVSDMRSQVPDIQVDTRQTEGATGQEETEYQNPNWSKYFGYYKEIPECKTATDTLVRWTIGDGFIADSETDAILDHIYGWGTDSFDDILENMDRVSSINGDSFAEQIRDPDTNILINLKPLDPGSMKTIAGKKGLIKGYVQISKSGKALKKFKPEEIFHLSNKRIADEIHGTSDYEALQKIIDALNESFVDFRTVVHRNVVPVRIIEVDTDDTTKIAAFQAKYESQIKHKEVIIIPKGTVNVKDAGLSGNATFNPLPWRQSLINYFFQVVGIPQILMGGASEFSESASKIAYLSFEQTVKQRQRYLITQVWNQLFLRIDLAMPASLKNEMLSDSSKDGPDQQMGFQPSDMMAGVGR